MPMNCRENCPLLPALAVVNSARNEIQKSMGAINSEQIETLAAEDYSLQQKMDEYVETEGETVAEVARTIKNLSRVALLCEIVVRDNTEVLLELDKTYNQIEEAEEKACGGPQTIRTFPWFKRNITVTCGSLLREQRLRGE